jgi:hypothetical protein
MGTASTTCGVVTRALTQDDFESGADAGSLGWSLEASAVDANGDNTTYDGAHSVSFTHTLVRDPRYRLGIKRLQYEDDDPAAAVQLAGMCTAGC